MPIQFVMRSGIAGLLVVLASSLCAAGIAIFISYQMRELPTLAPMLKKITPSVVNVAVKRHPASGKDEETRAAGSGVIVDASRGLVMSDNHVINNADDIAVTLTDRRRLKATRIGSDPGTDVAILKLQDQVLTAIQFGDSDRLQMGDFVIAIGNPFEIGQTATLGIVGGLRRSGLGIERYENFIQTDAALNPGNSGGALVNLKGELVGINTAIVGPTGGNVGIGFAVPINMARAIMEQILKYGDVRHGELGILMQDLTSDMRQKQNLAQDQFGVVIIKVDPGSAAARAGLAADDIVTAFGRAAVRDSADLSNKLGLLRVGDEVELTVLRAGQLRVVRAVLEEAQPEGKPIERKK